MTIPTISRYVETISQPYGLLRTLTDMICERDIYGDPVVIAGGNSAVFKIWSAGKTYALKCYTKHDRHYAPIYHRLSAISSPLLYKTRYLPGEIYVFGLDGSGLWCDAMVTEWADGHTLEYEILRALHYSSKGSMRVLADSFDSMALELLAEPWAHGDLKPCNITVDAEGRMRLLDYDAMFFPDMEGQTARETGTPQYQHPIRNAEYYDKSIDDYSIALISATLHVLAVMPQAAAKYGKKDILLFHPADILSGKSKSHKAMKQLCAQNGDSRLYRLLSLLESPSPKIDGLSDIIAFGRRSGSDDDHATPSAVTGEPICIKGTWGYGTEGATTIPPMFDSALDFSEGLAAVTIGGYCHFIGPDGKTVINCAGYRQIKPFSCGAAAVMHGEMWGYIDHSGNEVVKPQYLSAGTLRDGKAVVTTQSGRKKTLKMTDPQTAGGTDI